MTKNLKLLDLIERQTKQGELLWEETELRNTFQAASASYSMRIKYRALSGYVTARQVMGGAPDESELENSALGEYILEIYNSEGRMTNEIKSANTPGVFDAGIIVGNVNVALQDLNEKDLIRHYLVSIYRLAKKQQDERQNDIDLLISELEGR